MLFLGHTICIFAYLRNHQTSNVYLSSKKFAYILLPRHTQYILHIVGIIKILILLTSEAV